ncbi:hypothetical protein ETAA8_04800 [Anatilimnocola aggregata]|uniref:Uncharacterized protein n=1 Tax=Anatilimnocola aggregata TaxID=2528021 RepID=A0A517Y5K8_9BACT|nr:hypothetical protein [Anatilimnocola aggregata]QDU25412.1 hypothetical protein ETAA8_04800 [Anatilimnocola aggregata]
MKSWVLTRRRWIGCLLCGLALSLTALSLPATAAEPPPQEAAGIDRGDEKRFIFVARDKATWEAVKKAVDRPQMLPIGFAKGTELQTLDKTDFEKQMIVAVFWGEMTFSGQGEKCWIESVQTGDKEVTVDCRALLWGGRASAAYRAWPYHAKVVARSEVPVKFTQTTEWKALPDRSEKDKLLGTIQPGEWQLEIKPGK